MTMQAFESCKFTEDNLIKINLCNEIIEHYQRKDLKLTLRQLYYQLVTRNAITNEEKSYKKLSTLVSNARLAGVMDWAAIEDRVRQPKIPLEFENLRHRVDSALQNYRLDRWKGQENYVELWVEKDALAGVLAPLADEYHITMMVNRGYSSQSAMYESAQRIAERCYTTDYSKLPIILYLGDHDPSGEDMVRDISRRLKMFTIDNITVRKIALTMEQVDQYEPAPNPTKVSDPRAKAYMEIHGDNSWEVDALSPEVTQDIIRDAILEYADMDLMHDIEAQEDVDKAILTRAVEQIESEES